MTITDLEMPFGFISRYLDGRIVVETRFLIQQTREPNEVNSYARKKPGVNDDKTEVFQCMKYAVDKSISRLESIVR